MIQLTTACVSSVNEVRGNSSNLLFSGQILPEHNAGLNGAPTLKLEPGAACVAAVFDGRGDDGCKAAYTAASAFRAAGAELRGIEDLEKLYTKIHNDIVAARSEEDAGAPMAVSAVSVCVDGERLSLANLGACRAYLLREKALYLLSRASADVGAQALPPMPGEGPALGDNTAPPFTVKGTILPGDQLLLCTGWLPAAMDAREILRTLLDNETPGDALQRLVKRAGTGRGDLALVLLKADAAPEAE